jgi:hypothetical protein
MFQILECLPGKGKALSSNPSTTKKKKRNLPQTHTEISYVWQCQSLIHFFPFSTKMEVTFLVYSPHF